jgi:Sulfotransferase domain
LKNIGLGFGLTGTMSTKQALEQLGFGPCHHMVDVMGNPAQPPHWDAIAAGPEVDWEDVFKGYTSQVDFPGAAVWDELSIFFPDARVIHTERPEDDWWARYSKTIGKFFADAPTLPLPPPIAAVFKTMDKLLVQGVFGGLDRARCIAAYRANNARVRATIPADRLLVFSPTDGWAALCKLPDVALPDAPFPNTNARDEFWAHFGGESADAVS